VPSTYVSVIGSVLLVACFAAGAWFIDEGAVWTDAHHPRGVATVSDSHCSLNTDETETQCDLTVTHNTQTDTSVSTRMTHGFNLILLIAA
jgi:hypothetical protein